ncbi:PhzF family phenazine biosynthesis protein [Aestuariicella hydrocarbonica]|uniref:PhzF family phenazine biosynthesis protein n=1 Tax=Pseudomaricurvus hydrocarbonicus TaxID=1470433 RepID=A0A9E5MQG8_9GAMM|nr:PhzF family phenazine biosynthesis protein [Aestuariicella hydrocarbonica]NHO68427.1 PhzF family phenazine biosynthesis protein [Aestuariicella hydrocarbonica]
MKLPLYQIDAFTTERFKGNPAAVVPLTEWLSDEQLQHIAAENNLSETAFFVPLTATASKETGNTDADFDFHLRWFTPTHEVDLCGHATLAAAFTLFEHLGFTGEQVRFKSLGGPLTVTRDEQQLRLDFPSRPPQPIPVPGAILQALGVDSVQFSGRSRDWLLVLDSEQTVANLTPNWYALAQAAQHPVIVTAKGERCDFVSRFFAPSLGINEDPVTGSAHCTLTPYWAGALNRTQLSARQISARGGELTCVLEGERVYLCGQGVTYLTGEIFI